MKFEFDSNNQTELRAVEAAVAMLLGKHAAAPLPGVHVQLAAGKSNFTPAPETEAQDNLVQEYAKVCIEGKQIGHTVVELLGASMPVPSVDLPGEQGTIASADATIQNGAEVDAAGQPWNAELHSSSRAKVADGTWKKKRNSGKTVAELVESGELPKPPVVEVVDEVSLPIAPMPPIPPAPPTTELVTMNQIWALISSQKATLNDVLAAAQRMGFADLGAVAQTATAEQRAALLKELTSPAS